MKLLLDAENTEHAHASVNVILAGQGITVMKVSTSCDCHFVHIFSYSTRTLKTTIKGSWSLCQEDFAKK